MVDEKESDIHYFGENPPANEENINPTSNTNGNNNQSGNNNKSIINNNPQGNNNPVMNNNPAGNNNQNINNNNNQTGNNTPIKVRNRLRDDSLTNEEKFEVLIEEHEKLASRVELLTFIIIILVVVIVVLLWLLGPYFDHITGEVNILRSFGII